MPPPKGFALAASMMVLALLSVLGVAAVQSTTLEVQLSARDRDARAALYVAEAALEEARYYAARGWGKLEPAGAGRVRVATATAGPADLWDGNRYAGFTLVDRTGATFAILFHTDGPNAVLDVAPGDPESGRFLVLREIPATSDPSVAWDAVTRELWVDDPVWAAGTSAGRWTGWVLWRADGTPLALEASGVAGLPPRVFLRLPADPGPGPFRLALNPWVAGLAAGIGLPGDRDATTPAWDRAFADGGGNPLGEARVEARSLATPGAFALTSSSTVERSGRQVSLTVERAGLPEQRMGNWKVEGGH